jgi:hypothetical protein
LQELDRLARSILRRRSDLAAENLMLRRQLAVLLERAPGRPRIDDRTRVSLALLSRVYGDCRRAVVVARLKR